VSRLNNLIKESESALINQVKLRDLDIDKLLEFIDKNTKCVCEYLNDTCPACKERYKLKKEMECRVR
jgi:hypothetical protein